MANPSKKEFDASHHFEELVKFFAQEDFDKALRTVNIILKELPDDQKALQSKAACLIQLSKFAEALEVLGQVQNQEVVLLPATYSLYRLNRYPEIIQRLSKAGGELSLELKELKAQTLYKLERYEDCLELYKELLKKQRDELDSERQCNFLAVLTQLQQNKTANIPIFAPSAYETYELSFNAAALDLAKGNYGDAEKKLRKAEKLFQAFAVEEDLSPEKIKAELTTLKTQLVSVQIQSSKKQPVEKPSGFSAESVESNFLNQFAKLKKKPKKDVGNVEAVSPKLKAGEKQQPSQSIKKKRKRKPRLPKSYDANVKPDPERWLPKVERSTYKKKKDKRSNVGKGTQGSTLPEAATANAPGTPKSLHTVNQPAGPRQQKPQAAAKKQAKKKRK